MNEDFSMDQGNLLKNVFDVQMRFGICYALSTEWCLCILKNRNFNVDEIFYPMVSRQRAYDMTYEHLIKNATKAPQYRQFFNAAEPPSYKFMKDQAKHENVQSQRQLVQPDKVEDELSAEIGAGKACILGIFGVVGGENFGHATAVGWRSITGGSPRFFDPNQGQYSWSASTDTDTISQEIITNLKVYWGYNTIRDYLIYSLT